MKTKLTRLWSFLLALVMVVGLLPAMGQVAYAATEGYITKIELNNFSYSIHENMKWEDAVAAMQYPDPVGSHYTFHAAYAPPRIFQDGRSVYYDDLLKAGECTIVIRVRADAGYEYINNLPVWINGELRTDVTVKKIEDSLYHDLEIHIPATVSEWYGTKYTVTYNSNGGSAVESQQVPAGFCSFATDTPTKENMVFDGWFTDAELTNEFIRATTPITSDITLYAKWNDKYITYIELFDFYPSPYLHDDNSGNGAGYQIKQTTGKPADANYNLSCYIFQNGNRVDESNLKVGEADCRMVISPYDGYALDEENLDNIEVVVNGELRTDLKIKTFYEEEKKRIYIEIPVTVAEYKEYSINVMEGMALVDGVEVTKAYPGTQIFLVADDAPEGNAFREWDANGARIEFPKNSETVFTMPGNNVSVTATYSKPYTVTVKNGVLANTGESTGQYFEGDTVEISANVYKGQTFGGWTSDDVFLKWSGKQTTSFTMPQNDVTVTANLSGAAEITEVVMTSDVSVPAIGWAVTDPGFTVTQGNPVYVKGGTWQKYDDTSGTWSNYSGETFEAGKYRYLAILRIKSADCTNYLMNYDVTATVNGNSWNVDNKITWEESDKLVQCTAYSPEYTAVKKYRVSFDANGGTGTMEDAVVSTGAARFYTLPENGFTAPAGKYFKGWAISPDSTRVGSPSTNCPITRDTTLYAIWGDITYIDTVDVTIPVPVLGESPQEGVSNTQGVSVSITEWWHNGYPMPASNTFGAGNTYKVHVIVKADNGYEFSNSPKVTFNGSTAGTVFCYGDDYINYYAEFTIPPIDTVDVTIREPVAGAFPQAAFSNTDNVSVNITEWWHNGYPMPSSAYFVAGETYKVHVIVYPDGQNLFAENPTVTFNGSTPGTVYSSGVNYINYYAEFTAVEPTIIDAVDVKVTKPVAGAHPQDVVSNTDHAIVTAMEWRCDGKLLSASDTFEEGVTYQLTVVVGVDSYKYEFSDDTIITFNGANTGKYVTNDYDYVIYDVWFTATAASAGVTVSGTATSFGSDTDNVILQLIAEGYSEADYEVFVKGNTAEYSIEGVSAGTYTMKVMKNNHVTREYTVTVGSSNVVQDVKIWLLGDVNGDGTINVKDKKLIFNHLNDPSGALTGYALDVGDVNRDGTINVKDKKLIFNHLKGISLWS